MKILIVDDDTSASDPLKLSLSEAFTNAVVEVHSKFDTAIEYIRKFGPDVVILDVYQGVNEIKGDAISLNIWNGHFCPVVIFTAKADRSQIPLKDHPFIRFTKKDSNGDVNVVQHVREFSPHIQALLAIHSEVSAATREGLRDVCTIIWDAVADDAGREELIGRITRRRMAAHLDSPVDEKPLKPWEQFIFPPVSATLLTGDILKCRESEDSDPSAYRMILTPSCDLVGGRSTPHVLVARSEPISAFVKATGNAGTPKDKLASKLHLRLRAEQVGGLIPLPKLPTIFPEMAINLKRLELIPFEWISLAESTQAFFRKTSVDSPFREKMAWAYLQVAGRPGVPDLDVEQFAAEIAANHQ